jgi:hypothetical protein
VFPISLAFEEELRRIEREEGTEALLEYYSANPTHTSAVGTIVAESHRMLSLIHFYTVDERRVKRWCLRQGKSIQESAAVVDVNIARWVYSYISSLSGLKRAGSGLASCGPLCGATWLQNAQTCYHAVAVRRLNTVTPGVSCLLVLRPQALLTW